MRQLLLAHDLGPLPERHGIRLVGLITGSGRVPFRLRFPSEKNLVTSAGSRNRSNFVPLGIRFAGYMSEDNRRDAWPARLVQSAHKS